MKKLSLYIFLVLIICSFANAGWFSKELYLNCFFTEESGNDYMRKNVYGRNVARQVMVDGFKNFREAGINTTALNIIGGPYETREQIFDTIQLNRELKANDKLVSIFQPFKGTALRDLCIKGGFISKDEDCIETTIEKSVLNMPQMSNLETLSLQEETLEWGQAENTPQL